MNLFDSIYISNVLGCTLIFIKKKEKTRLFYLRFEIIE